MTINLGVIPVFNRVTLFQWALDAMEKLIAALAEKLPANAGRTTVELAFRAAVDALPKSKLRNSALLKQDRLIARLVALVRKKKTEEIPGEAEPEVEDQEPGLHSCYEGVDTDKPGDCLQHCKSLLQDALVSLDPAARAEEALRDFVALFPPEADWRLEIGDLQTLAEILALAATVGLEDTIAWTRFLGLSISAVLRVEEQAPERDSGQTDEALQRLSCTVKLLVQQPSVARAAVRIAMAGGSVDDAVTLQRLVPILLPLLRSGFLRGSGAAHRGDLLALLSGLRVLQLATRSGLASEKLSEVRTILTTALSRDYDATPLVPELTRIAEEHVRHLKRGKTLLKNLQAAEAKTSSAAATAAIIEATAKELQHSELARLVGFSGLPVGDDEQIDAKAASARARGDLFFEDTAPDVPLESLLVGGSSAAQEAMAQVQKRKLGNLEGVENICVDDASQNPEAGEGSKKRRKSVA